MTGVSGEVRAVHSEVIEVHCRHLQTSGWSMGSSVDAILVRNCHWIPEC